MSLIDVFGAATAMLLIFVLSQIVLQHAVEGVAVGWSCETVCMACLCVHPACIVLSPMGCLWRQRTFNVFSGSVLSPVAADTSFGTPVFSSCSKQVRDVS